MKKCTMCDRELSDTAKFCGKCGSECKEIINDLICASCGTPLGEDVQFCGNCGNKKTPPEIEKNSPQVLKEHIIDNQKSETPFLQTRKKWLIALGALLLGLFIGVLSELSGPGEKYILNAARIVVDENLSSPGSAIYRNEKILDKDEYGRYLVYLVVDSENGFGASRRSEWTVIVRDVTKDKFAYNPYSATMHSNGNDFLDIQSETMQGVLKKQNGWNEPPE